VKRSYCRQCVTDRRFMVTCLKYHLLPERRVEITRKLRSAMPDEEVQRMLLISIVAPWTDN